MVCCYFVHDAYIEMAAGELLRLCRWRGKTGTQVWQVIAAPVPALAWDCYHLVDTGLKTVAEEPTAELCLNDPQSLHQPSLYSPATQLSLFLDTHRVSRFGQKKKALLRELLKTGRKRKLLHLHLTHPLSLQQVLRLKIRRQEKNVWDWRLHNHIKIHVS